MSAAESLALAPFEPAHATLLAEWLRQSHVARWYPDPAERIKWALEWPPGGYQALIVLGARPIGYLRWQTVSRKALDDVGLAEIPAGSIDIDILIGEPDGVGRGHGARALTLLVETLRSDGTGPLLGLSPSIDNAAAQRAYEKAGFRKSREYAAPGFGRLVLMVRPLE